MAHLDELIADIKDRSLREKIEGAVAEVKRHQRFGLVFEEHIPEITAIQGLPVVPGAIVQRRDDTGAACLHRVAAVTTRGIATIEPIEPGPSEHVPVRDLLVVKRFGDPIYPALTSLGVVHNGPPEKPYHAVINGENYHALQLFTYIYEGQVDCVYIDPPYNTGARDWKYNNRYVDKNDSWRHSKWLSFMEKRLKLAKRLLNPTGVLICTIDEHEVHHLGMLLERVFPEYLQYMVTIVINPKGREKANFAPVDEYAFFIVPNTEEDIILRAPSRPAGESNIPDTTQDAEDIDDLGDEEDDENADSEDSDEEAAPAEEEWEYRHARRRGGGAESSSYREKRPNQFYPIYIDENQRTVVSAGESIPLGQEPTFRKVNGLRPLWPIDAEGRHRCWAFIPSSMQRMIDAGNVCLGKYHAKRDDWTLKYRVPKKATRKLKTVWWEKPHDAGTHGTELLKKILGQPGLFPFPKSVYAVRDCLAAVGTQPTERSHC